MTRDVRLPGPADRAEALKVVRRELSPTPVVPAPALAARAAIKLESWQPTGSFKVRGALAALSSSGAGTPVVTVSTGNHAMAMAWAGQRLGASVTVVVPETASPVKLEGLRRLGARVERVGTHFDEAEAYALGLAGDGRIFVSSYNDTAVIAGQSTIGAELDAQASGGLTVVCPVGGGGLLTGLALWAAQRSDVDLIGVEPHASRALSAAIAAGRVVSVETQPTLSDGTAGNIEDGSITWPVIRDRVSEIVHVDEAEIAEAIRFLAAEHGLVAEGSGALATAALLAGKVTVRRQPVALLSGRNIPVVTLSRVLGEP